MPLLNLGVEDDLKTQIKTGTFVQSIMDKHIRACTPDKEWDGYIHPSYLDWEKSPEQQVQGLLKKGKTQKPVEMHRYFQLGNLIHEDIQTAFEKYLPGYAEIGWKSDKYLFAGTADYVGLHPKLGGIVFEFKSYGELQRDTAGGKVLFNKIQHQLLPDKVVNIKGEEVTVTYGFGSSTFTQKQLDETGERLLTKERVLVAPESNHLTQGFTYAWIFNKIGYGVQRIDVERNGKVREVLKKRVLPGIKWVCICYIGKNKYQTSEFWYSLKKHSDLVKRAESNYKRVLKRYWEVVR